eukprot:g2092.t1
MTDSTRFNKKSYGYGRKGAKAEPCPHPLSDLVDSSRKSEHSASPTRLDFQVPPISSVRRRIPLTRNVEVQTDLTGKDIDRLLKLEEEYKTLKISDSLLKKEDNNNNSTQGGGGGSSGRLLLIGGATDCFSTQVEEFDPVKESWKELYEIPACEVEWMSAACTPQGSSVFVLGEVDFEFSSKIGLLWKLETQKGEWKELPRLLFPRVNLCLVDLDSRLYALGGTCRTETMDTVEQFDFHKEQWIAVQSMEKPRSQFGAVAVHGGIYTFGGLDDHFLYRSGEFLDPRQGTWRKLKKMKNARVAFGCVHYKDCVYLIGGFPAPNEDSVDSLSPSTDIYELRMNQWREGPPLNHQRAWCAAAVLDSPCVIGGKSSLSGNDSNAPMEQLDIANEAWIESSALECSGHRAFCSAVVVPVRNGVWRFGDHRPYSTVLPRLSLPSCPRASYSCLQSACFRVYSAMASPAERAMEVPREAHGFRLVRQEYIKEYDSEALVYLHEKTGAEVMSMVNNDENKCFGVIFRTPVNDSTGTPHILEHSVLCGSEKYPIKEPFVELIKGSLQTFLNAMTYPDRTCYPVASCNTQDFYNLMDIYLDAVFFPNCVNDPRIFAQEGWHYELDNKDEPMTYKGVVFNEMKGAMSSPDSVHYTKAMSYLFPDNTYQYESGGDPVDIPNLTFEQFRNFHSTYYHPSNCRIWIYGDDDPLKRLEILNEYLKKFDKKEVDSKIQPQPFMEESKTITEPFAAGESDKTFISLHWLLAEDHMDTKTQLAVEFLNYLLLGTPASPLYKKLNDSELGEAVLSYGLGDYLRQPTFGVGLKGVDTQNVAKVEPLIIEELTRIASEGFPKNSVEAAMNTIEFSLRENNTGRYPRGLALMVRAISSWNYDKDPLESMKWEEPLNNLKKQLESGTDVFGDLIRKLLLENNHRVKYEMQPDTKLGAKTAQEEEQKLQELKSGMSSEDLDLQVQFTAELKRRQETPDSPEDLKCIPILKLEDIPKEAPKIPTEVIETENATYLIHDLFTNDILYFTLAMDMRCLPTGLLPLVPLFCECLTELGTKNNDFVQLTELIGRKTGGVSASPMVTNKRGTNEPVAKVFVSGKATKDKVEDLMTIIREILLDVKLDNKERFKQLVLETKAGMESSIISSGHSFVVRRLAAQRTVANAANELMSGIEYLTYIRDLIERVDRDWNGVLTELEAYTISAASVSIDKLLKNLPKQEYPSQTWDVVLPVQNEAFTVPTQVNYIGKGVDLFKESEYSVSGSSGVITKHLYATWLWDKVRVSGGAYGCMTGLDTESGIMTFTSYRDPNLLETVQVYDGVPSFLKESKMDDNALTKAIIGAIGSVDAYQLPDAKGQTAMMRHFLGITNEWRQERRDELLATTAKDFEKFGEQLEAIKSDKATIVAVTSHEKATEVENQNEGFWKVTKIL